MYKLIPAAFLLFASFMFFHGEIPVWGWLFMALAAWLIFSAFRGSK